MGGWGESLGSREIRQGREPYDNDWGSIYSVTWEEQGVLKGDKEKCRKCSSNSSINHSAFKKKKGTACHRDRLESGEETRHIDKGKWTPVKKSVLEHCMPENK